MLYMLYIYILNDEVIGVGSGPRLAVIKLHYEESTLLVYVPWCCPSDLITHVRHKSLFEFSL